MTPAQRLNLRQCAAERAHLYGAQALILEKEADALAQEARRAKHRYFRELEAVDLLGGHGPSPFAELG